MKAGWFNSLLTAGALALPLAWLPAQTNPASRPRFAVASIRPAAGSGRESYGTGNGKGYGQNATLKTLIGLAYQVQQFQIAGGPGWTASERFDVEGKSDDPKADFAQLRLMLQTLLEDRYKLKLHVETREAPVYALMIAKSGLRMKLSSDQNDIDDVGAPASPADGPKHGGMLMGPGTLVANAVPLSRFVRILAPRLDRSVIDKTGLTGRFDIQLDWSPETQNSYEPGGSALTSTAAADHPSIFTATQEQLGLKLEATRGPVESLIIDHAEKPDAN